MKSAGYVMHFLHVLETCQLHHYSASQIGGLGAEDDPHNLKFAPFTAND